MNVEAADLGTGVERETLLSVGASISSLPDDFNPHRNIKKIYNASAARQAHAQPMGQILDPAHPPPPAHTHPPMFRQNPSRTFRLCDSFQGRSHDRACPFLNPLFASFRVRTAPT
jgi:hypothetical protein